MIRNFADTESERIFRLVRLRKPALPIQRAALRKLLILDAAESLNDLSAIPGNRLEKLLGDRKGQYSIRVNDQYRICFRWESGEACDVELVDYH